MSKQSPAQGVPRVLSSPIDLDAPKRRGSLLASTAVAGVFVAVIAGHPGRALAQSCSTSGSSPVTVLCDAPGGTITTANTTNSTSPNAATNDRVQSFNADMIGTVTASTTVNGFGLQLAPTGSGRAITMTNSGVVTTNQAAVSAIGLVGNGGAVSYSGSGSVINTAAGTALSASNTGSGSVLVTSDGSVTTGAGGTGIDAATSGTGSVTVSGSGSVTSGLGISAAASGGGDVTVTGSGAITAGGQGIHATASGGNGNIVIARDGVISSGGIAIVTSVAGAGTSTVTISRDVTSSAGEGVLASTQAGTNTVTVTGGTVRSNFPGSNAISVGSSSGAINVTIGSAATLRTWNSGGGVGIGAFSSTGNVTIANSGTIIGNVGGVSTLTAGVSTVINAGSITGLTGTAVRFGSGSNNLLVMDGSNAKLVGLAIGHGTDTFRFAGSGSNSFDVGQISTGWALLDKTGSSNWTLTGTATYVGPVTVNGGTLAVNGDLSSASSLAVNAGGTLGGNGILGAVAINGGTLAPGNSIGTLTTASLTMTAASTYLVQVSGATSDKTIVTGVASINGKVVVDPLTRVAATTTYTIMSAGTVSGSFTGAEFLAANSFARNARLSYVGNDVLLTLDAGTLSSSLPGNANINQRNVAAGIDGALLGGAAMPASFNALFALSGTPLLNALTQVSGETATGTQQTTFNAMNMFLGLLTDPFVAGRDDPRSPSGATGYAADDSDALAYAGGRKRTGAERDAYAAIYRKAPVQSFEQRWNVWAAGFGGSQTTDGNATLGSNAATSRIAGATAGADYWFSPNTVAGFALAGGGTSFSVANGGTGRSDLFQAGAFVRHNAGAAYVTGALAYGWQDITTDRNVTIAGLDHLQARFNANAYSGRLEGGYRFVAPVIGGVGLTPYAAAQFTTFDLPAYAEQAVTGNNTFALSYASKSVTDTRSELGLRTDKSFAMADGIATLRGRLAWAHDFNPDRAIGATFQALPGSSFVVNGAAQAADSALVTASVEKKWATGWSAAGTFEGEFSNVTRSYAGKGVVRYAW
ncbi:autotransporter domain-containing protein [Bradyrhizobium sp. KB893862 SZCCT0404]|uniref:autotransporter outer membrane beta-barrel domain-containing protein n=1 Tax=Bradyrhizobium sp. KB893862 SZCCT0404 TaxID=2807672 RepID=UPI001BAAC2C2|nr:autotransporter domain-containing protein [Bradyrhizobium sp. KB893862 SZCCT0404]MBR1176712.1 autotransporter domain-containing protein [Bradyrhizobium sp. KB893862 SZCCT0404]